jgi:hypothetical protein
MNPQDQARKLCERAAGSRDPDELAEILVELRALTRQHFAHVKEPTEERRHGANRENRLGKSACKTGLMETKASEL